MSTSPADARVVAIVGGGYSGTCCAIHLLRESTLPLEVFLIEPRDRLGEGLAHSSSDPDHRLNAPAPIHVVLADRPGHLEAWLTSEGRLDRDPEAVSGGSVYPRRSDFADFVRAQLLEAAANAQRIRSGLHHIRTHAVGLEHDGGRFRIALQSGEPLDADLCVVATGHERPHPPPCIAEAVAQSPCFIHDPWDLDALRAIESKGSVLLIGSGLTAADMVATLLKGAGCARITALSRHGYLPRSHNPLGFGRSLWEAIQDPVPVFVAKHGTPSRVVDIMQVLKRNIVCELEAGRTWHGAFDEVRNAGRALWNALPEHEKHRFLRHARSLYDSHRFRLPPQTAAILESAMRDDRLRIMAARIQSVTRHGAGFDVEYRLRRDATTQRARFDAIVNCMGPEIRVRQSRNPFIRSLLERGLACEDQAGLGLRTDADGQAIGVDGSAIPHLYLLGPLTRGQVGETPAVPVITLQAVNLARSLATSGLLRG
jgi:uncharacterized NAD(P)/FAD-binding protein YdhS